MPVIAATTAARMNVIMIRFLFIATPFVIIYDKLWIFDPSAILKCFKSAPFRFSGIAALHPERDKGVMLAIRQRVFQFDPASFIDQIIPFLIQIFRRIITAVGSALNGIQSGIQKEVDSFSGFIKHDFENVTVPAAFQWFFQICILSHNEKFPFFEYRTSCNPYGLTVTWIMPKGNPEKKRGRII
jgi:hypothetical protein